MEWLIGVAGGLMMSGLVMGGLLGNLWILVAGIAAGSIVAGAGSWCQQAQARAVEHERLAQYPSYKY